jgi:hypothetical protein
MKPLLDRLKGAPASLTFADHVKDEGTPPDNMDWFDVLTAYGNGKLTEEQFDQCHDAMSNG